MNTFTISTTLYNMHVSTQVRITADDGRITVDTAPLVNIYGVNNLLDSPLIKTNSFCAMSNALVYLRELPEVFEMALKGQYPTEYDLLRCILFSDGREPVEGVCLAPEDPMVW